MIKKIIWATQHFLAVINNLKILSPKDRFEVKQNISFIFLLCRCFPDVSLLYDVF
jgi:hypothetical protein